MVVTELFVSFLNSSTFWTILRLPFPIMIVFAKKNYYYIFIFTIVNTFMSFMETSEEGIIRAGLLLHSSLFFRDWHFHPTDIKTRRLSLRRVFFSLELIHVV